MDSRYRFTRAWGAVTAALGWMVVALTPLVFWLAASTQTHTLPRGSNPLAFLILAALAGLLAGILIGGLLIVSGQLLRLAVDSLHVQLAMLDRPRRAGQRAPRGQLGRRAVLRVGGGIAL